MGRVLTLIRALNTLWTTPHQVTGSHRFPTGSGTAPTGSADDRFPVPLPLRGNRSVTPPEPTSYLRLFHSHRFPPARAPHTTAIRGAHT